MSNMTDPDALRPLVRTCQIIIGALIAGVFFFLLITLFITHVMMPPAAPVGGMAVGAGAIPAPGGGSLPLPLISLIAVAFGIMNLAMSFVVPKLVVDQGRRKVALAGPDAVTQSDPSGPKQLYPAGYTGKLAALYQTQLIIGAALLEGAAFFAVIAYLLERSPIALLTALVLLGVMFTRFPTGDRVNNWLDQQLSLLQEER